VGKLLRLRVLTPAETMIDVEEATRLQARLVDGGGISIYPGHAPLIAETVTAPLRYTDPAGEHTLEVKAGILVVDAGAVTIFTSGHAQPSESQQLSPGSEMRFDRLAQALLATMRAQSREMLDLGLDVSDEGE